MSTVTYPEAAGTIPFTAYELVPVAREVYRRAQRADWPEEGRTTLLRLSSRLWTETEIIARVRDDGGTVTPGRVATARKAATDLLLALHAWCGPEAALAATAAEEAQAA